MKVGANKRKFEKKIVRKETRAYEAKRQEELNQERVDPWKIERVFATLNMMKLANWTWQSPKMANSCS